MQRLSLMRHLPVALAVSLLVITQAAAQHSGRRHLLNPIYEESNKFVGPDKPAFKYKNNPSPASYTSDLKVRSEKPYVDIYHKEPANKVEAKGSTKVDTWEGAKFNYKSGKGGSEWKFNSGKRAFEVNHNTAYQVNFPETDIKVGGGQPILVDHQVAVTPPIANETAVFTSGDGPSYKNEWAVNVGSNMNGGHVHGRRRNLLAWLGRHLLNPIYEESNKFVGPDKPAFKYKNNPSPASYTSDLKVRSEKPYVDIYHKEPANKVEAKGSTKVDTWEGAKFNYKSGKGGSEWKFNSGKRAFEVNHNTAYQVNFPETDIKVGGGQPILVDHQVAVTPPIANETAVFTSGDGPSYKNEWAVNVGSNMNGGHVHGRRRNLLAWLGRHLLNPIYEESNKFVGPDKPAFKYKNNPSPASYTSDLKVRSEKPYVDIYHKEPANKVEAKGSTKVDTWEGAKFNYKSGKGGSEWKFNSGKRAFEVNHNTAYQVNFPETDIKVGGGQPILVDHQVAVTPPIANETAVFTSGDGPSYKNEWAVNVGSNMNGGHVHGRRRNLLAWLGRHLLNPIYEESNKFVGPDKPAFKYKNNPSPASYTSDLKVRSEKPYVDIYHKEPANKVEAKGSTKVDTWEGAKFNYKSGKGGSEWKFNSGKRAFEVNHNTAYQVNFPETDIKVGGGQPILVDHQVAVTPPIANETAVFTSGDGPSYKNEWAVNVGSNMNGGHVHGRRRRQ